MAQLGTPDMKLPIQYALYYPDRRYLPGERLDFWTLSHLDFGKPDLDTFYCLALAYEAGRAGGTLPTVFNAANELAVKKFLLKEIKYLEIMEIIEDCMRPTRTGPTPVWRRSWKRKRPLMSGLKAGGREKLGYYFGNTAF